tara:strand:- start:1369 stop:2118 length:750 start_codon:yes stop_codon:yes gene_type:complete
MYEKCKDNLEIIWVPADDPIEFKRYLPKQPWKSIPLESNKRFLINVRTCTKGIPQLWLISATTGKVLSHEIPEIMNTDLNNWLEHAQRLEEADTYNWITDLCSTVFDADENVFDTDTLFANKKIILLVFLLPGNTNFDSVVENLKYVYEKESEEIEIVWVPNNNMEGYASLKKILPGYHYRMGDPQINKLVQLFRLEQTPLPVVHPVIKKNGVMKSDIVRKLLYAKDTIRLTKMFEKHTTQYNLHYFGI